MKKCKFIIALALVALTGCQTTEMRADKEADISANSKVHYVDESTLKNENNIEVPPGYNIKEFLKLAIAPYVVELKMEKDGATF